MKALVYFQPSLESIEFEGARVRKNIKGALEVNNIVYTTNVYDDYDVAYLMNVVDEKIIDIIKEKNVPVIVSALYAENDLEASFLEYKNKDGKRILVLKSKALRMLNRADLVLVPSKENVELLRLNGVASRIEVCEGGVNSSRFDFSRADEKELFYRYFREDPKKPLVVCFADYGNKLEGLSALIAAAKACPNVNFYFFGQKETKKKMGFFSYRKILHSPKNLKCREIMSEDIYRSAMINAKILVASSYKPIGVTIIQDAMAAKCQIIARKSAVFTDLIIDGETGYIGEFSETITSLIVDFLEGREQPTTEEAYKHISEYNLENYGLKLINYYKELTK